MTTPMTLAEFPMVPLRQVIDQLFNEALTAFPFRWDSTGMRVPVDIYEGTDHYLVRIALPGVQPGEVNLTCENNRLIISGERRPVVGEGLRPICQEIGAGAFRREIYLPVDVDAAKAEATYDQGILTVTLPKVAEAVPKTIKVRPAQMVAA
jgi:HSP20 family protein